MVYEKESEKIVGTWVTLYNCTIESVDCTSSFVLQSFVKPYYTFARSLNMEVISMSNGV